MVNPRLVIEKFSAFHQRLGKDKKLGGGLACWRRFGWSRCSGPPDKGESLRMLLSAPRLVTPRALAFAAKCGEERRDAGSGSWPLLSGAQVGSLAPAGPRAKSSGTGAVT